MNSLALMKALLQRHRRRLAWGAKFLITLLMLYLAFRRVSYAEFWNAMSNVKLGWALASVGVLLTGIIPAEAWRFQRAGTHLEERQPGFRTWVRLYLESRPFTYLLPASVGAEGLVWVRLRAFGWSHESCAFAVVITRAWGMSFWALVMALGLASSPFRGVLQELPAMFVAPWVWFSISAGGFVASLALPHRLARRGRLRLRPQVLLRQAWAMLAGTFAAATVVTLALLLAAYSAGVRLSWLEGAWFLALINFAMVLPISLGGLGLQDALALRFGLLLGVGTGPVLAFSVVLHLQRLALAALGGVVLLAGRRDGKGASVNPEVQGTDLGSG